MNRNAVYLLLLSSLALLSSCCSNVTEPCTYGTLGIRAWGYRSFNEGKIMAVRYVQNNNFDIAIDTLAITPNPIGNDSQSLSFRIFDATNPTHYVADSFSSGLLAGYDYQIFFPADSLTYAITGMVVTGNKQMAMKHCGEKQEVGCFRNIVTCKVNGTATTTRFIEPKIQAYQQNYSFITLVK